MKTLRRLLLAGLTAPPIRPVFAPLLRGRATIFVLHRFRHPDLGTAGHDPDLLRRLLGMLRRDRYPLVGLQDLFHRLADGAPPPDRAIVFTLDDGYADQATIAADVFAEFDCPATVFVTTRFVDGELWMWWDKIEHILERTQQQELDVPLGRAVLRYRRDPVAGYAAAQADLTERCKHVPEEEKQAAIGRLGHAAEVALPDRPPARYAAMTWNDVRVCERRGFTFGAHSVSHPVLAQTTDEQSRTEIAHSWARLRREATAPLPIFCYPSGQAWEYGPREVATLRSLGFLGAVCGTPTYADSRSVKRDPDGRFHVPRFGYPDEPLAFAQYASGLERLKQIVRRRSA